MWSVDKILKVLVVINYGGLHIYRLGASPLLLSTFDFNTLVSWQSMNDMLIINIIYATKHDHNKRRASAPLQFALPARHLDPTPRPPSCAIRSHAAPSACTACRREKLRFLTREAIHMRNILTKYAEVVLANLVKRMRERDAMQREDDN